MVYKNKEMEKQKRKERLLKRKVLVFTYYSKPSIFCACCGDWRFEFLQIDHINGDGGSHRKELGKNGNLLYAWIIKNNFPAGFQVLCRGCNNIKKKLPKCPCRWSIVNRAKQGIPLPNPPV